MSLPLPLVHSGKVRDLYAVGDDQLLLVASDRLSAYDVILPTPIPDKGAVLTGLSLWWFEQLADVVPNHVVTADVVGALPELEPWAARGRGPLGAGQEARDGGGGVRRPRLPDAAAG